MLKYQKDRIRKIHIFQISGKELKILDPYELLKLVEKEMSSFVSIEPASPFRANIIVRVYQKSHYKYDFGETYNLYGADCYVRKWFRWCTESNGKLYSLNRTGNQVKYWLYPDEYIIFDTDFIDMYFRG